MRGGGGRGTGNTVPRAFPFFVDEEGKSPGNEVEGLGKN